MTADSLLWGRYEHHVQDWERHERDRAVSLYRKAHPQHDSEQHPSEDTTDALDGVSPTLTELVPPPVATQEPVLPAIRAPQPPAPATLGDAVKWGCGGFGVTAVVWGLVMGAGWKDGSGHVIPALIVLGLMLAVLGGAATATVRYFVRRSQHSDKQQRYQFEAEQASIQYAAQDRAAMDARSARIDSDADHLLWEQLQQRHALHQENSKSSEQEGVTDPGKTPTPEAATDQDILAEFDAGHGARVRDAIDRARTDGDAPASPRGWLADVAVMSKRTADALDDMESRGWTVAPISSTDTRDIVVVSAADVLPADTTVMFHHATPDQLRSGEEYIAVYDDATLDYRPVPGTEHEVPEGLPPRVVHVYTHWKVRGLDDLTDSCGVIGTDAFLTDWTRLATTVREAEL